VALEGRAALLARICGANESVRAVTIGGLTPKEARAVADGLHPSMYSFTHIHAMCTTTKLLILSCNGL
jgi:hypothetical protein